MRRARSDLPWRAGALDYSNDSDLLMSKSAINVYSENLWRDTGGEHSKPQFRAAVNILLAP